MAGGDRAITNAPENFQRKESSQDLRLNLVDLQGDHPIKPEDGRTRLALLGLEYYPETDVRRNSDNIRLEDLAKQLPENSFSKIMLKDMRKLGLDNVDIWYGSNVQLNGVDGQAGDGGALYRQWSQLPGVSPRESSHEHLGQEYQIKTGSKNSAVLFGCNPSGNTFFQVEHNYAGGDDHGRDYQLYRELKQNIGAEGISPITDKHPIVPTIG